MTLATANGAVGVSIPATPRAPPHSSVPGMPASKVNIQLAGWACLLAYGLGVVIMVGCGYAAVAAFGCAGCAERDAVIAAQQAAIAELEARVERLERLVSRNSDNSSFPPSMDGQPGP